MASKTNKINFYLIKGETAFDDIFKQPVDDLEMMTVKEGYDLYYDTKSVIAAPWVKAFLNTEIKETSSNGREYHVFNAASSQAVLLRKVLINNENVTFAICFGTGYHLLKKDAFELRFGLITVLNIVGENSLRKIDKHDISGTPKFTAEQLSKKGGQMDFGLDIELDILLGATGTLDKKVKREDRLRDIFGTTLSGKSNLSINAKFDIDNIDKLLKTSYVAFNTKRYESKGFAWIDKIDLVKKNTLLHSQLTSKLDECLIDSTVNHKIWLAVPELVEWQDVQGFYFGNAKASLFEDVTFDALKEVVAGDISVQALQSTQVNALHANGEKTAYSWSAYQCLYAEVSLDNKSYILINSEWYKLKEDFIAETNAKFQNIVDNHTSDISFKEYQTTHRNENGYNADMTQGISNAVCMDAQNISHGGGHSKIEFCDIFDRDNKKIIHIKKYSGSSVLSHLFAQGLVSAQLLLDDEKFRLKTENKIKEVSGVDYTFAEGAEYEVVFGIIAKPGKQDLPLFSKVNLNSIFARIRNMRGYTASIAFIANSATLALAENNDEAA